MVTVYRLVSPRWAATAFSGEGARLYGGRWNSPGRPVVYTASTRALCALELLVHLTTPGSRAKPYVLVEYSIPEDGIDTLDLTDLPEGWDWEPASKPSQSLGDAWLKRSSSLALRVPSTLIPEEANLLINPEHPQFGEGKLGRQSEFRFDQRLAETS